MNWVIGMSRRVVQSNWKQFSGAMQARWDMLIGDRFIARRCVQSTRTRTSVLALHANENRSHHVKKTKQEKMELIVSEGEDGKS
jgi:hypothetical protein